MTELKEIYKCVVCENVAGIFRSGVGSLVCCIEDMEKLEAETKDKGQE